MLSLDRIDVLSPNHAADLLECSVEQVELLTRRGELPGLKYGVGWIYPKQALLLVLNNRALEQMAKRAAPDPAEHPASAARAAVVPVGTELPPRRNARQTPPTLSVVPSPPERA